MHPGFFHWWKHQRHAHGGCGPGSEHAEGSEYGGHSGHDGGHGHHGPGEVYDSPPGHRWHASHDDGGGFGVRRPLRFLAYKLDLDEGQVAKLAKALSDLKTERAQAAVDDRRAQAVLADAVAAATFDVAKADEAGSLRVKTAERLKEAVQKALGAIHGLLLPEQRDKLAYLIRTGVVTL